MILYNQKTSFGNYLLFLIQPFISLGMGVYTFTLLPNFGGLIIALIFVFVDFAPALILIINYLLNVKRRTFVIFSDKIEIKRKGDLKVITNKEIQKIHFCYTKRRAESRLSYVTASWEYLYYGTIILKTGEHYIFTCLNGYSFEKRLKKMNGVLFDKEIRFPIIK